VQCSSGCVLPQRHASPPALPLLLLSQVSEQQFPREVPLQLFLRLVPLMRRVGLLHFHGFLNALASDPMPLHVQRLRCRCMFHALTFLPAVHATAQLAIQRLRSAAGALPRVQEQWMDGEDEAGKHGAGNGENRGKKYERERMEGQVESQEKIQVKGQVNGTSGQVHTDIGHLSSQEPDPSAGIPRYVAAHIPFDAGQERDEAEEEAEQLRDIRQLLFPVLHAFEQQGRLNAPDWYRRIGRCPVAPEEAALVLAGMGVGRLRPVFLVGVSAEPCRLVLGGEGVLSGGDGGMQGGREEEWREGGRQGVAWEEEQEQEERMRGQQEEQLRGQGRRWFNGCRRLEAVRALFPSIASIDTLLSPQEIAPFSHSPLLITALETIVAGESDLFLAADGSSQLAALVAGRRMYIGARSDKGSDCRTSGCTPTNESGYQHGYRPSVRINRAQLAEDLGGGKVLRAGEEWIGDAEERVMEWEEVEERTSCECEWFHSPPACLPSRQSLYDMGSNLLTRVLSGGDMSGMPTASGEVSDLVGRPLFFALHNWFLELGGVYRLAFGPKAFVVISDPIVARHVLKENPFAYDKGMLAELLEPIMGKGLIPADFDTWKQRRRAIVPGFHAAYLEAMALVFSECSKRSVDKLQALCDEGGAGADAEGVRVDMESEYSSIALDIIGISVFNYDFGSVTRESPVIKAVYGTLSEAEHRATFYIPYWNIPLISLVVPRQMKFQQDLKVVNDCLDDLITRARSTRQEDDLEALQQRDYSKVRDASLLRFLVDLRGEDCDDKQLRDDLMTMLVAGHETTAAVLTWATYMLAQNPHVLAKLQEEVDTVLGDRLATLQDIKSLEYTRLVVSEALRLYPQPPLLIRRALANDHLPPGYNGNPEGYNLPKGTDLFVSVFNINRSPHYWENPEEFRPERFLERRSGDGIPGWDGYDPDRLAGALYPNEVASDFAFLPFGGGPRKCVGDQFALMESTVALAMILRRFNVRLDGPPEDTEMVMGATMHTKSGLWCRLTPRGDTAVAADAATASATANA
ncbi:unnamed protein product, partial [Closterium sp. Naga37s-1]